jgi:cytochrome d ubiquinol oxidase subunit I
VLAARFVAGLAGWVTAEVGRQPVVYGLLRTADAVSPVQAARRPLILFVPSMA